MPAYSEVQWMLAAIDNIGQDPDLLADKAAYGQGFALWCRLMKIVVQSKRTATDWNLTKVGTHVNASAELVDGAGTLYGVFAWCTDTSEAHVLMIRDTTTAITLNSGAMNAAETAANEYALVNIPATTAVTQPAYGTIIIPDGLGCSLGITYAGDGVGGNAPAANALKAYYVWRTGTSEHD